MFLHYNGKVMNDSSIEWIDYSELVAKGYIRVYYKHSSPQIWELVEGPEAFNVMMRICPDALEGAQAKYQRHAWAVHNILGHPLMQIFSWLGLSKLGLAIHDKTVPNPITK